MVSIFLVVFSSNKFTFNDDFFEEMYSNSGLKQVTIFIFFFGAIFGLFLELGIIWYEKHESHRYRTAINQLFSTISWLVISYIILVFIPDGIRYLTGPFSETFCDCHNFLKNFLCSCYRRRHTERVTPLRFRRLRHRPRNSWEHTYWEPRATPY